MILIKQQYSKWIQGSANTKKKTQFTHKIKTDKMRDILKVVKETRQFFLKGVTTILKPDFYYYINF